MSERNPTPGPSTLRQSTSVPCKRRVSSSHSPQQYPAPISEYTNPPEILPSLTMEIYSHRTTVDEDIAGSDKTNERLTMLGERMLEFVALQTILSRKTYVPVGDMLSETDRLLAHDRVDEWVRYYNLRDQLRYRRGIVNIDSHEETRALFTAYVGALVCSSSPNVVVEWLARLIDPDNVPQFREHASERDRIAQSESHSMPNSSQRRLAKRTRDKSSTISSPQFEQGSPHSHSSSTPAYPTPSSEPGSIVSSSISLLQQRSPFASSQAATPAPSQTSFLQAFNIKCAQNHYSLDYQAEFSGPPHAGNWTVKCVVNGAIIGHGTGSSKQIAKEEAAKQAFYHMGWTTSPTLY